MYWYCNIELSPVFGWFWLVPTTWVFRETVEWWDTPQASPLTARCFRYFSFFYSDSRFAGKLFMQVSYFPLYCLGLRFLQPGLQIFSLFQSSHFQIKNSSSWASVASGFNQLWMFAQFLFCIDSGSLLWSRNLSDFWSSAFSIDRRTNRSSLVSFELILLSIGIVL